MPPDMASRRYDRVAERSRAVTLARHFREAEGLSIAQIATRLGRSPATIKAYFYDPRLSLTKDLHIAPRASASLGATRAVCGETQHLEIGVIGVAVPLGEAWPATGGGLAAAAGSCSERTTRQSGAGHGPRSTRYRNRGKGIARVGDAGVAKRSSSRRVSAETPTCLTSPKRWRARPPAPRRMRSWPGLPPAHECSQVRSVGNPLLE